MKRLFTFAVAAAILSMLSCTKPDVGQGDSDGNPTDTTQVVPKEYVSVGVDDFEALIDDPAVQLVDVRTKSEYDEGHIAGAALIDVYQSDFKEQALEMLDRNRPVAVYCRSGVRSRTASDTLSKEGFAVTNLDKGIQSWIAAGKPVTK